MGLVTCEYLGASRESELNLDFEEKEDFYFD